MEVAIFYLIGMFLGIAIGLSYSKREKIYGIIDVDHRNEVCAVRITSSELINPKTKKAVFEINHEANLSRKEQIL